MERIKDKVPPLDFPLGLFVGAASVAVIVLVGNAVVEAGDGWSTIYAAILGGLFSVIAVWGAFYGVFLQLKAQAELLDHQRVARLAAERAMLPATLETLMRHCEERIDGFIRLGSQKIQGKAPALSGLQACIELSDGIAHEQLVDLVSLFSIADSRDDTFSQADRLRGMALDRLLAPGAPEQYHEFGKIVIMQIFLWSAVAARISNLFPYSYLAAEQPKWETIDYKFLERIARTSEEKMLNGQKLAENEIYSSLKSGLFVVGFSFCRKEWRQETFSPAT